MMGLFLLYMSPVIIIIIYIIVGFFIKLYKEYKQGLMYKNNIFKEIDIKYARLDTVKNALDSVENYHKMEKIGNDVLLFINEYNISIIMVKNYSGQLIGKATDNYLTLKTDQGEETVENPQILFNKIDDILKTKLNKYKYKKYLIIGSICLTNLKLNNIKILRMKEFFYFINQISNKKNYSKNEIDEIFMKFN